jgi:hypothetical protein
MELVDLCDEMVVCVLSFLMPMDLSRVAEVNKRVASIVKNHRIWRRAFTNFCVSHKFDFSGVLCYWKDLQLQLPNDHLRSYVFNLICFEKFAMQTTDLLVVFKTQKTCTDMVIANISQKFFNKHRHIKLFKKYNTTANSINGIKKLRINDVVPLFWGDAIRLIYSLVKLKYTYIPGDTIMSKIKKVFCEFCNKPNASILCSKCEEAVYCNYECLQSDWNKYHENTCPLNTDNVKRRYAQMKEWELIDAIEKIIN